MFQKMDFHANHVHTDCGEENAEMFVDAFITKGTTHVQIATLYYIGLIYFFNALLISYHLFSVLIFLSFPPDHSSDTSMLTKVSCIFIQIVQT